jgi:nucleotide-binding universal stress UspA family protein
MLALRTILHPTDFSEYSAPAFRLACSLARDHGARVLVLHVMETPPRVYGGVMTPPSPQEILAEERRIAREELAKIQAPAPAPAVEHLLVEGDPGGVILQVARDRACDLIVLGTHGRKGLLRLLMGSVAEQVVRGAGCPVVSVKQPPPPARPAVAAAPAEAAAPAPVAQGS